MQVLSGGSCRCFCGRWNYRACPSLFPHPGYCIYDLCYITFCCTSLQKQSSASCLLAPGLWPWSYDLLWPMACGRNDSVLIPIRFQALHVSVGPFMLRLLPQGELFSVKGCPSTQTLEQAQRSRAAPIGQTFSKKTVATRA